MAIRTFKYPKSLTDQEILDKYKQETQCGECSIGPTISPTTEPPRMIRPPGETIALVVNISKTGGRLKIYERTTSGKFVTDVNQDDSDVFAIVPWNSEWHYYSIGSLKVRYISAIDDQGHISEDRGQKS